MKKEQIDQYKNPTLLSNFGVQIIFETFLLPFVDKDPPHKICTIQISSSHPPLDLPTLHFLTGRLPTLFLKKPFCCIDHKLSFKNIWTNNLSKYNKGCVLVGTKTSNDNNKSNNTTTTTSNLYIPCPSTTIFVQFYDLMYVVLAVGIVQHSCINQI